MDYSMLVLVVFEYNGRRIVLVLTAIYLVWYVPYKNHWIVMLWQTT